VSHFKAKMHQNSIPGVCPFVWLSVCALDGVWHIIAIKKRCRRRSDLEIMVKMADGREMSDKPAQIHEEIFNADTRNRQSVAGEERFPRDGQTLGAVHAVVVFRHDLTSQIHSTTVHGVQLASVDYYCFAFWPMSKEPWALNTEVMKKLTYNWLAGCERVLKRDRVPLLQSHW